MKNENRNIVIGVIMAAGYLAWKHILGGGIDVGGGDGETSQAWREWLNKDLDGTVTNSSLYYGDNIGLGSIGGGILTSDERGDVWINTYGGNEQVDIDKVSQSLRENLDPDKYDVDKEIAKWKYLASNPDYADYVTRSEMWDDFKNGLKDKF